MQTMNDSKGLSDCVRPQVCVPSNLKPSSAKLKYPRKLRNSIHDQVREKNHFTLEGRTVCAVVQICTYEKEPKIHSATAVPPTIKMLSLFPPIRALTARI